LSPLLPRVSPSQAVPVTGTLRPDRPRERRRHICNDTSASASKCFHMMKKPLITNYPSASSSTRIGFLSIALDSVIQNGHPRRPQKCPCCFGL